MYSIIRSTTSLYTQPPNSAHIYLHTYIHARTYTHTHTHAQIYLRMNKWLERARERLALVKGQGQRVAAQARKKATPSDVIGKEIIVDGFTPPRQESKSLFDLEHAEKKERRTKEKK